MSRALAAILRHADYEQPADTPSAWLPHPLTRLGREQAAQAADELLALADNAGLEILGVIDCSPLLRAWETASIIADRLRQRTGREFAVAEHLALAERSVGAAANLTIAQIEAVLERDPRSAKPSPGWKAAADYLLPLPGAETLRQAGERVAAHLEQSVHKAFASVTRDGMKVFVGHGAAFRYAAVKLGVLSDAQAPELSMFHGKPVLLEKLSNGWRQAGGEWKQRTRGALD